MGSGTRCDRGRHTRRHNFQAYGSRRDAWRCGSPVPVSVLPLAASVDFPGDAGRYLVSNVALATSRNRCSCRQCHRHSSEPFHEARTELRENPEIVLASGNRCMRTGLTEIARHPFGSVSKVGAQNHAMGAKIWLAFFARHADFMSLIVTTLMANRLFSSATI